MSILFRLFCLLFVLASPALAASPGGVSSWVETPQGKVRLIAATTGIGGPGGADEIRLGLQFSLLPGWKIYWRSPGEAGIPPSIDWTGSENLAGDAADFHWFWPTPQRFSFYGLQTVGYAGDVVLPINARAKAPSLPAHLRGRVDFLVCSDICVPQTAALALDLDAGTGEPGAEHHLLERFRSKVPGSGALHGFSLVSASRFAEGDKSFLRLVLRAEQAPWDAPDAFVHGDGSYDAPQLSLSEDGREATLTLEEFAPADPEHLSITIVDGERAFEAQAQVSPAGAPAPLSPLQPPSRTLLTILVFAVAGGLLLNVMPCVLPVLAIKALGIINLAEQDNRHVRLSFLASAAGIMVSFWLLALVAIGIKMAGIAVGWGIQFQQPAFLIFMIVILVLFAANLLGLFEIPLPGWLSGLTVERRTTLRSHFFSGMLATLLATPCSAPFLGTAVGFALARGSWEIIAVFTALGLGLGAPYLAMSLWPSLVYRLPRPGRWMLTVRRLLGLALLATALWLGTVLATQSGWWGKSSAESQPADGWVAFDPSAIPALVAAGKTVFVDVTADWCLTCKVNKTVVLEREEIQRRLKEPDVVRMRGDWTTPDAAISAYLNTFGRYGIPFNAVYGPGQPQGKALPELLSENAVLEALDTAALKNKKE